MLTNILTITRLATLGIYGIIGEIGTCKLFDWQTNQSLEQMRAVQ